MPGSGENLYGAVDLYGTAMHKDFLKWELDLLLYGDAQQSVHLQTRGQPANGWLYSLDTQQYPNGNHSLRMRVVRSDTNYDEYFVTFNIRN